MDTAKKFLRPPACFLFEKLIKPKSADAESARREFILNVFLVASAILLCVALVVVIRNSILSGAGHESNSPWHVGVIFLSLVTLLLFSRLGFHKTASHLFLFVHFAAVGNSVYAFGIDEPETLLGSALLIVMSGVLFGSRFVFFALLLSPTLIIGIGYAQINHWYTIYVLTIIAVAVWLSNREIEKSLARARRSEAALKRERDTLEGVVEKRMRKLKETQAEKMAQIYRFAEFGRLSAGLFHDLINPLTAVSLNLEQAAVLHDAPSKERSSGIEKSYAVSQAAEARRCVSRAASAAKRMEGLVSAVRRQLSRQEHRILFSPRVEIREVIEVLSYKALTAGVTVRFARAANVSTYGDAVKFNQVALNLIANAIDACESMRALRRCEVMVLLKEKGSNIVFTVRDNGVGIAGEHKQKLFEPFFTTKKEEQGLGIGLSLVKRIIENDFHGAIEVKSREGRGSTFRVTFPVNTSQ